MAKRPVRPIRSEAEYEAALDEIESYFDKQPEPGTPAGDRFDLLALVIEDYERKHWPVEAPDPVEAIRYRMQTGGFTQTDLGRLFGSRQRASDVLARKRPLTLEMAWKLHRAWAVPAEALLTPQIPASPIGRRFLSSAIKSLAYRPRKKKLSVTFVTGKTYEYDDVPKAVYEAFRTASSKGAYFNKVIRDHYRFVEVDRLAG
jgi:HTH-type transcriptional regulator/antitoxin HigA